MNLAVKYRPTKFDEVVEQSVIVEVLKSLCESPTLDNRNFLLTGPAGCGKTTLARIIGSELNNGDGDIIEIDAASHNGVDSVRELIQQARRYPIGCEYKVFIIDECFPANSLVLTGDGTKEISQIHVGDSIFNFDGLSKVKSVFENHVKPKNLIYLRVFDRDLITTQDHLLFTNNGWKKAKDIKVGDLLYDYETLQSLRKGISGKVSQRFKSDVQRGVPEQTYGDENEGPPYQIISENVSDMWKDLLDSSEYKCHNLFQTMWNCLQEAESEFGIEIGSTLKTLAYIYMSGVWSYYGDTEQRSSDSMFVQVCYEDAIQTDEEFGYNKDLYMVWKFIYSELFQSTSENLQQRMPICSNPFLYIREIERKIIQSNEGKESDVRSKMYRKDDTNKESKWNFTSRSCDSWWKRSLNTTSVDTEAFIGRLLDIGVSCENWSEGEESRPLSYKLQVRPGVSKIKARDRGGWCRAQSEISTVVRRKKDEMSERFRVDCVEVYKRGYNDELFQSSFTREELYSEYVTMYDLEVDGHPSYFVNGILVHNCHSFSNQAWQVLLKTFEESPAKSVFILATTNPEKIPATILSRVQTFQLSKLSLSGIVNRLKYVIGEENKCGRNIMYDEDSINFIAKLANGGMRDSLTLLDKALAYSINLDMVSISQSLNLPNYDNYFELLNGYAKGDNTRIAKIVDHVYNSGTNFVKWFEGFHSFVMNVVKYILLKDIKSTMIPSYYQDKISKYSNPHLIICLRLANKLLVMNNELKLTQYLQEVALTHLCSIPKKV